MHQKGRNVATNGYLLKILIMKTSLTSSTSSATYTVITTGAKHDRPKDSEEVKAAKEDTGCYNRSQRGQK